MVSPVSGGRGVPTNDYFDAGSWDSWNFVKWGSGGAELDTKKLKDFAFDLSVKMLNAGVKELTLSFAQMADIGKLTKEPPDFGGCSSTDIFSMIYKSTGGAKSPGGENAIQCLIKDLHENGIKTSLSFGGQAAQESDYKLGFNKTSPAELASKFADFINDYHLDGIDFDLEDSARNIVKDNGAKNLATFFKDLHSDTNVPITLTLMGDSNTWGLNGSAFKDLFQQGIPFNQMFDGMNLMLYNGTHYITPQIIKPWIDDLMKNMGVDAEEAASYLHIGFNPAVKYGDNNPKAAADIYKQCLNQLRADYGDKNLNFNTPFFWAGDQEKVPYSFEKEFFNALNS